MTIRAPHGMTISCQSWQQEGALRCLMNNLDPAVAERPEDLIVYERPRQGGYSRLARHFTPSRAN